jgi:chromosomal replication initiation ATPase DnaA
MPDIAVAAPFVTTGGFIPQNPVWTAPKTPRAIVAAELTALAESYGLSLADLTNGNLRPHVFPARLHAYAHLRESGWTYTKIARFFGRDHSTIISGVRRHAERAK